MDMSLRIHRQEGRNGLARLLVPDTADQVHPLRKGVAMKKFIWIFILALPAFSAAPAQEAANFGAFYSSLSAQGEWIIVEGGTYAWRPADVEADWRPYSNGRWVWTDDGWYWSSDESWAWATYHYGRWYFDDYYNWCWIPGYEWAPAWVEWRFGGSCVGWAPLGPYAVYSTGWGIHYRRYWETPHFYWSFVDCRYISSPYVNRYVYRTDENRRFIGSTRTTGSVRYDNGRIVTRGPEREFVERQGNIRIERADIVDVRERGQVGLARLGSRERVAVYRPKIDEGSRGIAGDRPERVRTDDHRIALDTRGTDIRRSDANGGQRDFRKAEEFRFLRPVEGPRPDGGRIDNLRVPSIVRPAEPDANRYRPRSERRVERVPAPTPNNAVKPNNNPDRPRQMPGIDRQAPPSVPPHVESDHGGSGRSTPSSRPEAPRGGGQRGGDGERGRHR